MTDKEIIHIPRGYFAALGRIVECVIGILVDRQVAAPALHVVHKITASVAWTIVADTHTHR